MNNSSHDARYLYDSNGQRVLKRGDRTEIVYPTQFIQLDRAKKLYTKHIFVGTTRISSKLYSPLIFKNNTTVKFNEINYNNIENTTIKNQLNKLAELLALKNLYPYFFYDQLLGTDIFRVKALVPGMENLIGPGHIKFPSERGVEVITDSTIKNSIE